MACEGEVGHDQLFIHSLSKQLEPLMAIRLSNSRKLPRRFLESHRTKKQVVYSPKNMRYVIPLRMNLTAGEV